MMAMRQIMLGRGGARWQNPYVANGLVAMWDGIWNAGGGQHDSDSKIWWDCIGGRPICLFSPHATVGQSGIVYQYNTVSDQYIASAMFGAALGDDDSYGWRFAEFVIGIGNVLDNNPYILAIGRRVVWLNMSSHYVGVTGFPDNTWTSPVTFAKGDTICISADYSSAGTSEKGSAVWVNGQSASHTGGYDSWNKNAYAPYAISNTYQVTSLYCFAGTYHAIRLYDRALTQREIDANHAVDVQRFSIT